eukprot:TRINITY_DN24484_c0_g1_i1.p1 TRINITY_DN24484_c0_g1~~TRINITY_DN24484_c0_g1_i1.p1  ORF type:complete len:340 (+),score=44.52 TRINITY_DN24484_c0_g1_i1:60-1022(+)
MCIRDSTGAYKQKQKELTYPIEKEKILEGRAPFQASFFTQFQLIFMRSLTSELRSPMGIRMKTFQAIFLSIMIVIVFGNIGTEISGIQNRNGLLFMFITVICMESIQGAMGTFSSERSLFLRERQNKQYSVTAFFWGKSMSEMPFHIIWPWIEISIVYFGCGLSTSLTEKYWIAVLLALIGFFSGSAYGILISVVFPSQEVAYSFLPIILVPLMVFGGYFVNQNKIPVYFYPFQYISPFKYGFQVLVWNEYTDNTALKCLQTIPPTCDPLGDHNFKEGLWTSLIILLVLGFILRVVSIYVLYKISTPPMYSALILSLIHI